MSAALEVPFVLPALYRKQAAAVCDPARITCIESTTKAGKTVGGMAWLTISILSESSPEDLLNEALAAMKGEYEGLVHVATEASIDGQPAKGYDLDFISLDFPISGLLRAIQTPDGAMLVQGQWSNVEIGDSSVSYADVVVAMLTSVELNFVYEDD